MKTVFSTFLLALASTLPTFADEAGVIDLTQLANYANQPVPDYITRDNTPANNPITDLGATLGRVLFYDKRLSINDTISCASCHKQENAFSDVAIASIGVDGTTGRHSMRLINNRFSQDPTRFWDERADTLEEQSTQPIQDHIEMGFSGIDGDPDFSDLVTKLSVIEEYQVLFVGVFGDATISEERIQLAIAQFIRSIQSFDSRYDEGREQVQNDTANFPNLTADENAGKTLFLQPVGGRNGGAGCAVCHRAPEFDIDPNSRNNGVISSLDGGLDLNNTRSPSLRDLVSPTGESHGGFMHDASLATLEDVVDHYDSIDSPNQNLDRRLAGRNGQGQELNLTAQEKSQLVAFLKTLSGTSIYTDTKLADPFDAAGELTLVVIPVESGELTFSGTGESREVTVTTTGVPNVDYILQSSTDLNTWIDTPTTADSSGVLSISTPAPQSAPKMFFRITYEAN